MKNILRNIRKLNKNNPEFVLIAIKTNSEEKSKEHLTFMSNALIILM